jgi:hypothetical protein
MTALSVSRSDWISTMLASASDLVPALDALRPKPDRSTGRVFSRISQQN